MASLSSCRRVLPLLRTHHENVSSSSSSELLFIMEQSTNENKERNNLQQQRSQRRLFHSSSNSGSSSSKSDWLVSTLSSDTAKSYFQSLRLRAASALTESLSPEDRDTLLQPYYLEQQQQQKEGFINDKEEKQKKEENDASLSIGEAIATAVAQETRKNEVQWQKKKEDIYRQAEQAAAERVQNDVLLLEHRKQKISQWAKDLHKEILTTTTTNPKKNNPPTDITTNHKNNANATTTKENDNDYHHPILGKVHVDLGYKQIYVVPARKLAAIPIWEKQRVYRHNRAKVMASDKMKTMHLGLPGVITLHESEDGNLSILDGQHRVGMMAVLEQNKQQQKSNNNSPSSSLDELNLDQVLVEVFAASSNNNDEDAATSSSTKTKKDDDELTTLWAQELFTEINKAEPVKLVDMPGIAKANERRIINIASTQLQEAYPDMFKASQRCRRPHLNIDNLRDAIFASNILSKIHTSKALFDYMLKQNDILAKKYKNMDMNNSDAATSADVSKSALVKAKRFGFYLGLESSWLYN